MINLIPDFLLMILRDLLRRKKDLRILLMSATLNANLFSNYFGSVPVIDIPGRTFPVEQIFLEDLLESTGYCLEARSQYAKVCFYFRRKKSKGLFLMTSRKIKPHLNHFPSLYAPLISSHNISFSPTNPYYVTSFMLTL